MACVEAKPTKGPVLQLHHLMDVQLLARFVSVTSHDLVDGHEVWARDVVRLAFQVRCLYGVRPALSQQ